MRTEPAEPSRTHRLWSSHRHSAGGEHRFDAALAPVAVRVFDDRAAQLERTDEAPRQEQEMRHDLAREAALGAPVEPGGGIRLPRPRPAREGDLDPNRPRLADRALRDPGPDLVDRERGDEGEVHGGARAFSAGRLDEAVRVGDVDGERLLAEHRALALEHAPDVAEMGRRRRGDVDAVACRNELVRRGRARRLREGVGEPVHGAGGWVPDPGDGDDFRIVNDCGAQQPLAHDAVADDPQPDRTQILLLRLDDSARATLATASMAEAGRRLARRWTRAPDR